jgi:hypothetical protein
MSKPYDATMKDLGAESPADFLATFDRPTTEPIRPINVDLSTVTTAADLVLGLGDPLREVVHIDFQASADEAKGADVLVYNGLLFRQYRVPVHSILGLLRPQAAHSEVTGSITYSARPEGADLIEGLTGVAQRLIQRLEGEPGTRQKKRLLTAAFVPTGLRVKPSQARQVFAGVRAMRESETFMAILDEGREIEARRAIRLVARRILGEPDEQTVTHLEGITDIDRLERIIQRAAIAPNWQDLLDTP